MVVTYKSLHKVKFPLYALKSENWWEQDGLLFLDDRVLDDKNMRGSNLGLRRAQTGDPRLYKLNKQIISVQGVLKSSYKYFIDSNGTPFIYEKTKMCKLSYKKIQKVSKRGNCSIITCYKTPPFDVPRPPLDGETWAGFIYLNGFPYILYEYSNGPKKDSYRKV